ncbi:MAG TPA: aspartate aminotransferase family protein [Candidatus Rokubacteria bacterium]|nr:MAG: glutamate-1-semialdehyde 2,1-aminomutase [Candidatus Rokubacteria bacterium GWA2_73_35]HBH02707.1 aspartate aminotransferase family protein [Candidatus Rokubacteria bacterium]
MDELLARAFQYLPGGSSWMWTLPPDVAFVVARGEGSRVWDTRGRAYIDYVLGSGPLLLGHAPPAVVAAVQAQAAKGSTYQWLSEPMIRLAERLCRAVPCARKVRFVSTGTEATMFAIRMARAFTGREKVLKFEGGWHGLHDYALTGTFPWSEAPFPTARPDVGGVPKGALESVLVAPFNDLGTTEEILAVHGRDVAAIIVEPLQRALRPATGFLQGLRALADRHKCLLIFDEVVTGFRLAWGGAQEFYGVLPDLATYGKALTCGYSLAAVCGRADVMDTADPARKGTLDYALLSGTLSGNPLACAAGLAALDELAREGVYPRLARLGRMLREGMAEVAARRGVGLQALGEGPIAQPVFLDPAAPALTERDLRRADGARAGRLGLELIRRGVFVIPGAKLYLSLAHSDADIAETLEAFDQALVASA